MAPKEPSEFELSLLAGYKHPIKNIQSLRKDLLLVNQLTSSINSYKEKQEIQYLRRAMNIIIILSNVFESSTLEYALYVVLPTDLWSEVATMLFELKISNDTRRIDARLLTLLSQLPSSR